MSVSIVSHEEVTGHEFDCRRMDLASPPFLFKPAGKLGRRSWESREECQSLLSSLQTVEGYQVEVLCRQHEGSEILRESWPFERLLQKFLEQKGDGAKEREKDKETSENSDSTDVSERAFDGDFVYLQWRGLPSPSQTKEMQEQERRDSGALPMQEGEASADVDGGERGRGEVSKPKPSQRLEGTGKGSRDASVELVRLMAERVYGFSQVGGGGGEMSDSLGSLYKVPASVLPSFVSAEDVRETNFWIGNWDTSGLHYDGLDNCLCVTDGWKDVDLYPPDLDTLIDLVPSLLEKERREDSGSSCDSEGEDAKTSESLCSHNYREQKRALGEVSSETCTSGKRPKTQEAEGEEERRSGDDRERVSESQSGGRTPMRLQLPITASVEGRRRFERDPSRQRRFPGFHRALSRRISVRVSAGSCLFIPAGWWHEVFTSQAAVAVNFWLSPAAVRLQHPASSSPLPSCSSSSPSSVVTAAAAGNGTAPLMSFCCTGRRREGFSLVDIDVERSGGALREKGYERNTGREVSSHSSARFPQEDSGNCDMPVEVSVSTERIAGLGSNSEQKAHCQRNAVCVHSKGEADQKIGVSSPLWSAPECNSIHPEKTERHASEIRGIPDRCIVAEDTGSFSAHSGKSTQPVPVLTADPQKGNKFDDATSAGRVLQDGPCGAGTAKLRPTLLFLRSPAFFAFVKRKLLSKLHSKPDPRVNESI